MLKYQYLVQCFCCHVKKGYLYYVILHKIDSEMNVKFDP